MKCNYKAPAVLLCTAMLLQAGLTGCAAAESSVTASELLSGGNTETTETTAETGTETNTTTEATATAAQSAAQITAEYTDRDLDGNWDANSAVTIECNGTSANVTGSGATAENGVVTITAAGVYVFSGSFDGQIVVAAGENDKVQLVLNGVSVTCADGPAINAQEADKVFVTLAEGTENTLTDGSSYAQTDEDAPNACLYAECDLTLNGSGALTVNGQYNHGIVTKDDLRVTGGSITVNAVNDGVKGRDSVSVCAGTLNITAGGDGIQANNDTDAAKGWICIDGGNFAITAGNDGIQAETQLQINGGDFTLQTGSGAANAKSLAADTSAKGLKAGGGIAITGGTVNADCADDAVHTNGSATISAGALTLASGDDGVHADATLTITGGSIAVTQSYEGLEGEVVEISGGDITVVASDDGINCAGGTDGGTGGVFGTDTFAHGGGMGGMGGTDSNAQLNITGGTIVVNAEGDGLDSNGVMTVSGGVVLVSGPTNSGNGALDTGTSATVNGGCVIAVGSTGMAVNFDSGTQGSWLADTGSQTAGTRLSLLDAEGNVLLSWVPDKDYTCAVLSCAALAEGKSYTVVCGGELTGTADVNGFAESGTVTGGTTAATTTLATLQSSDVTGMGGGMGGRGGMGGMKGDCGDFTGSMPDGTAGATPPSDAGGNMGDMGEMKGNRGDFAATPDTTDGAAPDASTAASTATA